MAEFCLDCRNKINETNDPKSKYIMSKRLEFCEGCNEMKPVVLLERIPLRERIKDAITAYIYLLFVKRRR